MEWVEWIARFLSFWLDRIIYGFISTVYNLLTDIAQTSIFDKDVFTVFSEKIYALLGIFMLFKVSFSIFTYIVDPDSFLDKSKGFSKLIGNVLITLALLVLTPWIFNLAMDFQRIILRNNVIGKLFSNAGATDVVINDYGNVMAYETLNAFYHIDSEVYPNCGNDMYNNSSGIQAGVESCVNSITMASSDQDAKQNLINTLVYAHNTRSVNVYMDFGVIFLKDANDNYVMYYLPILSTLAGGAIVLLLIVFCFDIAVRSVKLGFLRMLAPVPIISRIDPKKGKEVFDKWLKVCISTYLDLFIRLLAIYFALFVVTQVINSSFVDAVTQNDTQVNVFVKVFIILGALLFAKQLPKLIEEITGVKMDGKFTLNPMNKLRQVPLVGAGVTTATALAGGAYTGFKAGVEAGHAGRGMWQGMMGAGREIRGKVPLMGDDKGGKSPRALHTGMQAGYKEITGKDFTQYGFWKDFGKETGEKEIKRYKDSKYALQGEQAKLDAALQSHYDRLKDIKTQIEKKNIEYNSATTEAEKNRIKAEISVMSKSQLSIEKDITDNRELYGKYTKNINSLDDQIKDIKRLYHIDDSPKKDVDDAMKTAEPFLPKNNNSQQP